MDEMKTENHVDYKHGQKVGYQLAAWDNDNGHFPSEVRHISSILGKAQYHIGLLDGMKAYASRYDVKPSIT